MGITASTLNYICRISGKRRSAHAYSLMFIAVVCIGIIGTDAWNNCKSREIALQNAVINEENLIRSLNQHADDTFHNADLALLGIVDRLKTNGIDADGLKQLHGIMSTLAMQQPSIESVYIYDSRGNWIMNSLPVEILPENIRDQNYFQYHLTHSDLAMRIGEPIKSPATGQWVIPVSRRLNNPDASFAGIASVNLKISYFQHFLDTFDLSHQSAMTLYRDDGTILARRPYLESNIGKSVYGGTLPSVRLPVMAGSFTARSPLDKVLRLSSYRHSDRYVTVAFVAMSRDEVLAEWMADTFHNLIRSLLLASVAGYLGYRLSVKIAKLRKAETETLEANRLLRMAEQMARIGHWRLSLPSQKVVWSEQVFRIYGLDPAEGEPDIAMAINAYHPEDRILVEQYIAEAINNGRDYEFKLRLIAADGGIRTVLSRGTCEKSSDGQTTAVFGIFMDISEQTQVLHSLQAAKDEAENANRAKSDFLATMSHEIRTPLNAVLGFSDILMQGPLNNEQLQQMSYLKDASRSLLAIINDVLDLSAIEAGKLKLAPEPFELRQLAEVAIAIVSPQARTKNLELRLSAAPELPTWVLGDPVRLRQVLLNLLSNAIKFTETGSVSLRLLADTEAPEDIRFEIRDTGIGIPADRQNMLFQKFSQIDRTSSRKIGGTGLGLAISKRLVEAMDAGRIGMVSESGSGSLFWFSASLPTTAPTIFNEETTDLRRARHSGLRILVAEDILINQIVIEKMLSDAGHRVTLVETGRGALAAVQRNTFDIVLMDMEMPEMNGLDAARAIRTLSGSVREIPIIALTANVLSGERTACRDAGMSAFLTKPIDRKILLETIDEWSLDRDILEQGRQPSSSSSTEIPPVFEPSAFQILARQIGPLKMATSEEILLKQLQSAAETLKRIEDLKDIKRTAHDLCATTGMFGFMEVGYYSRCLLSALRMNDSDHDIPALVADLADSVRRAEAFLARHQSEEAARIERGRRTLKQIAS